MSKSRISWAAAGDINAFFGLMLDNVAGLLLTVGLLKEAFDFPADFVIRHMVPGTAVGVLVGDVMFFWMAVSLARRKERASAADQVTAMPLGLDTPSIFGMVFFVLGPAFVTGQATMSREAAAMHAWHIGICSMLASGLFKLACAAGSHWVRQVVPRAGLLGSLAAVALVLISFLPLLEVLRYPVVGLASLAVILATLVARVRFPGRVPGALASLLVGLAIYYAMQASGSLGEVEPPQFNPREGLLPTAWVGAFRWEWTAAIRDSISYLPVVIPFALATVVGGIDCTESAAAAGDEFDTNRVIGVEAVATLLAGLCGGVIQTTPYIGHPAYKAMGGRAAYTLATALFVGGAGLLGYFGYLYLVIPKVTVFPILIFVGLEITAQSFLATPQRHYPAVAIACLPALAALVLVFFSSFQGQVAGQAAGLNAQLAILVESREMLTEPARQALDQAVATGRALESIAGNPATGLVGEPLGSLGRELHTLRILNNGFIITSLLWASTLAALIDRRLARAAGYLAVAGVAAAVGIMHSPMPGSPLVNPFSLPDNLPIRAAGQTPIYLASAYFVTAALLWAWSKCSPAGGTHR